MTEESRTLRLCFCEERIRAMGAAGTNTFCYSYQKAAWYFTDAPTRSMSKAAHFRAFIDRSEYDHVDHTGEPFYWIDCCFCGGILPGTEERKATGQADGEGQET